MPIPEQPDPPEGGFGRCSTGWIRDRGGVEARPGGYATAEGWKRDRSRLSATAEGWKRDRVLEPPRYLG